MQSSQIGIFRKSKNDLLQLQLFDSPKKKWIKVAELGEYQFFGEIAVLKNIPRTATVVAETPVEVLLLSKFEFINRITVQTLKSFREHMIGTFVYWCC